MILKTGKWVIESLYQKNSSLILTTGRNPFGQNYWMYKRDLQTTNFYPFEEAKELCGVKENKKLILTFSACYPNQFTCSSGQCIPLMFVPQILIIRAFFQICRFISSKKCDNVADCEDESDEVGCKFLHVPKFYYPDTIPRSAFSTQNDSQNEKLQIYMKIYIVSISAIDSVEMKFTSDFIFLLNW